MTKLKTTSALKKDPRDMTAGEINRALDKIEEASSKITKLENS